MKVTPIIPKKPNREKTILFQSRIIPSMTAKIIEAIIIKMTAAKDKTITVCITLCFITVNLFANPSVRLNQGNTTFYG